MDKYEATYKAYENNKVDMYKKYHDVYLADKKELAEAKEKLIDAEKNKKQMTIHYKTMLNALYELKGYSWQDEKAAFDEYARQVEERKAAEEERKQAERERRLELARQREREKEASEYAQYHNSGYRGR